MPEPILTIDHRERALALLEEAQRYPLASASGHGLLLAANVHATLALAPATRGASRKTSPAKDPAA